LKPIRKRKKEEERGRKRKKEEGRGRKRKEEEGRGRKRKEERRRKRTSEEIEDWVVAFVTFFTRKQEIHILGTPGIVTSTNKKNASYTKP
jgi:hypothetical protein